MPRIVACGGREQAFEAFCTAVKNGEKALLLVDSECSVSNTFQQGNDIHTWLPWAYLQWHDDWQIPQGAYDTDCHLMAQCMETWLLADKHALQRFFGQQFHTNALPNTPQSLKNIAKIQIMEALKSATEHCEKTGKYSKGEHSFKLLACIDPRIVMEKCPWAKRFIEILKELL